MRKEYIYETGFFINTAQVDEFFDEMQEKDEDISIVGYSAGDSGIWITIKRQMDL